MAAQSAPNSCSVKEAPGARYSAQLVPTREAEALKLAVREAEALELGAPEFGVRELVSLPGFDSLAAKRAPDWVTGCPMPTRAVSDS